MQDCGMIWAAVGEQSYVGYALVAQLVERMPEKHGVGGSNPS